MKHCEKFHWDGPATHSSVTFPRLLNKSSTLANLMSESRGSIGCLRSSEAQVEDEHHSKLGEHAAILWKYGKITDVTIKLRGRSYPAHKTVLSCYSKYFKDIFLGPNSDDSVFHIKLQSITTNAFEVLLKYMYTAKLDLTCQNIGEVFTAARKLRIDSAFKICTNILSGKSRIDVHSLYVYVTAQKLGIRDSADRALQLTSKRFEQIVGTPEFLDLNVDQLCELLSLQELATRSEVIVYLAALKWISSRYLEREEHAPRVLSCVRFPEMTLSEILACHNPPLVPGITEMAAVRDMLLKATCFVAAKTVNEEKRFDKYSCKPRSYLLHREPIILWDPNIFDPERHAQYVEELAAETIQRAYRSYRERRNLHSAYDIAARRIQGSYRDYVNRKNALETSLRGSIGSQTSDEHRPSHDTQTDMPLDKPGMFWKRSFSGERKGIGGDTGAPCDKKRRQDMIQATKKVKAAMDDLLAEAKAEDDRLRLAAHKLEHAQLVEAKLEDAVGKPKIGVDKVEQILDQDTKKTSHVQEYPPQQHPPQQHPPQQFPPQHQATAEKVDERQFLTIDYPCRPSFSPVAREAVHRIYTHPSSRSDSLLHIMAHGARKADFKAASAPQTRRWDSSAIVIAGGFESDLVAGGRQTVENTLHLGTEMYHYIPALDEWSYMGEMKNRRHHHSILYLDNHLYFIGGCDPKVTLTGQKMVPLKNCDRYDMASKTWKPMNDMNHCRMYHGVATLNKLIYVVGGKNEDDVLLGSVECYDPVTDSWTETESGLPAPAMALGVCAQGGLLWVTGGMLQDLSGRLCVISDVMTYNPTNETWSRDVSKLPYPRCFGSQVSCGQRVYLMGGTTYSEREDGSELKSVSDVHYYDAVTDDWVADTPLPFPRHFAGTATVGEAVYLLGGLTTIPRASTEDVIVHDETMGTWRSCESLPKQLCGFAVTTVPRIM